jgi:hypothetical protein
LVVKFIKQLLLPCLIKFSKISKLVALSKGSPPLNPILLADLKSILLLKLSSRRVQFFVDLTPLRVSNCPHALLDPLPQITQVLSSKGQDLLRTKGILAYEGDERRFAFQAVHMIADGDFIGPWKEGDPRRSKLVFIGRDLNRPWLRRGFEACQAGEDEAKINAEIARWSPPEA